MGHHGKVGEKADDIKGTVRRIYTSPNRTTLHAEREFLGSFESRTGTPVVEGTPHEDNEVKRVSR